MTKKILITLGIIVLAISSCNTQQNIENENGTIENQKWELIEFMNKPVKGNADEFYIIFNSEDSRVNTKVGCNNMIALYQKVNDSEIKIDKISSTRMACPDGLVNEYEYSKQLQSVNKYSFSQDGNKLSLKNNEVTIAVYKLVKK